MDGIWEALTSGWGPWIVTLIAALCALFVKYIRKLIFRTIIKTLERAFNGSRMTQGDVDHTNIIIERLDNLRHKLEADRAWIWTFSNGRTFTPGISEWTLNLTYASTSPHLMSRMREFQRIPHTLLVDWIRPIFGKCTPGIVPLSCDKCRESKICRYANSEMAGRVFSVETDILHPCSDTQSILLANDIKRMIFAPLIINGSISGIICVCYLDASKHLDMPCRYIQEESKAISWEMRESTRFGRSWLGWMLRLLSEDRGSSND